VLTVDGGDTVFWRDSLLARECANA